MTEAFRPVRDDEVGAVVALWQRAGMIRPWNPPEADITAIRANPKSALLVAGPGGHIVATVAVEDGGHRAWVYYLCADPALRGQGWGRRAMEAAEDWARARGHTKLQLLVRRSNAPVLSFYDRLGYEESAVTVMQKWLDPARERAFRDSPDAH
ncbi:MAG: GNAT family acetyltransferase [Alphaproteobacteria bacterium HGW-Alphaproteobacteria-6]|nr:MAG: GNAT family acetyltransferase [Alphaproteobacteria bacterium HGW-Alphaproteobacteria-6]